MGHSVDVFTRRDRPDLPERAEWMGGVQIVHVPAGPATFVPKEALLQHMPAFSQFVLDSCAAASPRYDVVHANFFMSGTTALQLKRLLGLPFVVTFHALGRVRREHQGEADGFPDERFALEEQIASAA